MRRFLQLLTLGVSLLASPLLANELNLYSSRHYDSDEALYQLFEEQTGIKINLIEGDTDALLTRLQNEGDLSEADVFVAVDAGRLHKAVEADLLSETNSAVLEARIPANLRHPDGLWFGISQRARVILLSKDVPADHATTYADLASDTIDGGLLVRSSSNIYNQSLVASFLASYDEADVEAWAEGVVDNMARKPQGGDRDQIRAVAAGEGEVALVNHYYFARMLAGDDDADREAASKLRLVWPDQDGRGVHVNISGAGILKNAPNRENAVKFLEFLTTPEAQELWALANYEYPVIDDPSLELPEVLRSFGEFKADTLNAAKLGELNRDAVRLMDRVRWR